MRWMMALVTAVCLACSPNVSVAPIDPKPGPTVLMWSALSVNQVYTLTRGLQREVVLCFQGSIRGDTAWVEELFMPAHLLSDTAEAATGPCPDRTVLAWHNHPSDEGDACWMSWMDMLSTHRYRRPFAAVASRVSGDTVRVCWWSLAQIRLGLMAYYFGEQQLLPPIESQDFVLATRRKDEKEP